MQEVSADKTGKFYVFLDGVTDPQNFGSILRSALFIGADGVIVNKDNACGLTATVSKVSSGALEVMPLYSVKFVKPFLEEATSKLNYKVISTNISEDLSAGGDVIPINELVLSKDDNLLLVLGSEGEGVSNLITSLASQRVMIPPCLDPL